jgi:hypothetical protein
MPPGSPVVGNGLAVPWAIAVDGNDHIWVSNLSWNPPAIMELRGYRTDTCPPGIKMGDPISPPGGYVGRLQMQVEIGVDPAGNVWVGNNWDKWEAVLGHVEEQDTTRGGGQTLVVFYGTANAGARADDWPGETVLIPKPMNPDDRWRQVISLPISKTGRTPNYDRHGDLRPQSMDPEAYLDQSLKRHRFTIFFGMRKTPSLSCIGGSLVQVTIRSRTRNPRHTHAALAVPERG